MQPDPFHVLMVPHWVEINEYNSPLTLGISSGARHVDDCHVVRHSVNLSDPTARTEDVEQLCGSIIGGPQILHFSRMEVFFTVVYRGAIFIDFHRTEQEMTRHFRIIYQWGLLSPGGYTQADPVMQPRGAWP